MKFMYKIVNNIVPLYLSELLLSRINDTVEHNSRNGSNFRSIHARTEQFKNSIILDGIKNWNRLSSDAKYIKNSQAFNRRITTKPEQNKLYNGFTRILNIAHAQLRINCSNLNDNLYKLHVIDNSSCSCSYRYEDCNHYFFDCPLYNGQRIKLLEVVNSLCTPDVNILLYGDSELSFPENELIFKSVELFILETDRLL